MALKLIDAEMPHDEWIDATAEQMMDAAIGIVKYESIDEWNCVRDALMDALMTVVKR